MRSPIAAALQLAVIVSLTLAACQSSGAGASPSTKALASTARESPRQTATETPLPLVAHRPSDIPTDGTCEEGHDCLGRLKAGTLYQSKVFKPRFSFKVPSNDWENLSETGGTIQLLPIDAPGDAIWFFTDPGATAPDGKPAAGVGDTVSDLSKWLALESAPARYPAEGGHGRRAQGSDDGTSPSPPAPSATTAIAPSRPASRSSRESILPNSRRGRGTGDWQVWRHSVSTC